MKTNNLLKPLAIALTIATTAWAQITVSETDWRTSNAITIKTADDLHELSRRTRSAIATERRNGFRNVRFTLANDIILIEPWTPIGHAVAISNGWWFRNLAASPSPFPFEGTFDGNNNVVRNVVIDNSLPHQIIGLFGFIGNLGRVMNLGVDINITSVPGSIGGLAGRNQGIIENSYSVGSIVITGSGLNAGGGLVGQNNPSAVIKNSFSAVNMLPENLTINWLYNNTLPRTGGFVGINAGEIIASYFTGRVLGHGARGGFVGYNANVGTDRSPRRGIIRNSYTTGDLILWGPANGCSGLFVGYNEGYIENVYATGRLLNVRGGNVSNAGTIGIAITRTITPNYPNASRLSTVNSFILPTTSYCNYHSRCLTPEQFRSQNSFPNWDFENLWAINPNINDGRPHLRALICSYFDNNHTWADWTATTPATCETEGEETRICAREGCTHVQTRSVAKLTGEECQGGTSIRPHQPTDTQYGIVLENAVVSDFARISVITPEPTTINLRILDNLGNVVFSADNVGAGFKPAPTNTDDNAIIWDLTNQSGRFVANGAYLIVVEAIGISGRRFTYSARIGVSR